jgi:hypothetical protein
MVTMMEKQQCIAQKRSVVASILFHFCLFFIVAETSGYSKIMKMIFYNLAYVYL